MARLPFPAAGALAAALLLAAPVRAQQAVAVPDSVTPERVLEGSDLFNVTGSCTFCHAPGGRGQGRNAPDLSDAEWLHSEGDYAGIFHTIWWGVERDEMKAEPRFRFEMHPRGGMPWTLAQTKAVAAYVWTISRPETSEFVMAQAAFLSDVRNDEVEKALAEFQTAGERWPGHPLAGERGLNALGYEILPADVDGALAVFRLNTELHPDSWNVWDSFAEAWMTKGDKAKAIQYYRKSLELNPDNQNAKDKLAELGA